MPVSWPHGGETKPRFSRRPKTQGLTRFLTHLQDTELLIIVENSMIALVIAALVLLQQTPSAFPGVRARIEGTVVRIGSNEPISGAKVTITVVNLATGANAQTAGALVGVSFNNSSPGGLPTGGAEALPLPISAVTTDRDGRFVVPELEGGTYRIAVSANGYVRQEYGQRVFPGQGTAGDRSGRFTLRGIPPGQYKVFAWEALEAFGYFDPELLKHSETLGRSVRVDESSRQEIDVRVILPGR